MSRAERVAGSALLRIAQAERAVTFAAFVVLVAVLFADVTMREITGAGLIWARQAGVYANLFLTLIGIGIASAAGAHLRPRFADRWLPRAWDRWLARVQDLLMSAFCLAFSLVAVAAVAETHMLGERTSLPDWPVWPFQSVIPAVFAVASLRHLAYAVFPRLAPGTTGGDPELQPVGGPSAAR
jgi:TRAP-type C4-dicarboxylate transport system permease small subunit